MRQLAIALLSIACAAPAAAHEFWLDAEPGLAAAGDTVLVRAAVGTEFSGEPRPYDPRHTVRLIARTDREHDLRDVAYPGDLAWARLVLPDDGGALVAYESDYSWIELPAAQFNAYLEEEGLYEVLAARARLGFEADPGRERYRRCAVAWVSGDDAERLTQALGLPLEIVPWAPPDSMLRARVLYQGRPLAGALVRVWRRGGPPVASARSNARGAVELPLRGSGEWLVSTVHMVPSADRRLADWESIWASLTFTLPADADAPARRR